MATRDPRKGDADCTPHARQPQLVNCCWDTPPIDGLQKDNPTPHTSCTPGAAATTERSKTEKGSPSMVVTAAPASCAISTPAQVSHGFSRYSQYPSEIPVQRGAKPCWNAVEAAAHGHQPGFCTNSRATEPGIQEGRGDLSAVQEGHQSASCSADVQAVGL